MLLKVDLEILISLQNCDINIDKIEKEMAEIPSKISRLEENFAKTKEKIEEIKNELNKIRIDRKNKEIELETKDSAIKKHQKELYAIKTNKEYSILQNEIAVLKKDASKIEDAILEIMESTERLTREHEEEQKNLQKEEQIMKEQIKKFEENKKNLFDDLSIRKKERENLAVKVLPVTLDRYEQIRRNKQGLAIVNIKQNTCGGCHMDMPLELINEARRNKELIFCENCSRIIYYKEI